MLRGSKRRGRPPVFDRVRALDAAEALFSRHGYEGTSLAMLTSALGCTPPTLYTAFGSKEGLYREALAAYHSKEVDTPASASADLSPYQIVERYLRAAAHQFVRKDSPAGCMIGVGALQCAPGNEKIAAAAASAREEAIRTFVTRLEQTQEGGHLPSGIDAESVARFYTAIVCGLSVQAIDGATYDQLNAIVDIALSAWPWSY